MRKLHVFILAFIFLLSAGFSTARDKKKSNVQIPQQQKTNAVNQDIFGDDPGRIFINAAAINVFDGRILSDSLTNQWLNVEKKIIFTKYLESKDGIMQFGKLGINGVIIYRAR